VFPKWLGGHPGNEETTLNSEVTATTKHVQYDYLINESSMTCICGVLLLL